MAAKKPQEKIRTVAFDNINADLDDDSFSKTGAAQDIGTRQTLDDMDEIRKKREVVEVKPPYPVKEKTASRKKQESKKADKRKKEEIVIYVNEKTKAKILSIAEKLSIPYGQIAALATEKFMANVEDAEEEIKKFIDKSPIPIFSQMIDLEKFRKTVQGSPLENSNKNK
jgi:hypothetical protein